MEMKKTKFFLDFDKQVAWIDSMAAQGWRLVRISNSMLTYYFVPCEPGEYKCQVTQTMKLSGFADKKRFDELRELAESSGASLVEFCGMPSKSALYIMYRTDDPAQALFTDLDSRIREYGFRTRVYFFSILILFLSAIGGGIVGYIFGETTGLHFLDGFPRGIVTGVLLTLLVVVGVIALVYLLSVVVLGLRNRKRAKQVMEQRTVFETIDEQEGEQ
jgi:hypothetical protein